MEIIQSNNKVYTQEQTAFINYDIKTSIILLSTAGSGKSQCTMERIKFLLSKGVDPKKIIFFSYTTAAVNEFKKRLNNDEVKITTIHAF
jgi:superfamily I DNA/RNA helicase